MYTAPYFGPRYGMERMYEKRIGYRGENLSLSQQNIPVCPCHPVEKHSLLENLADHYCSGCGN